jgi:hypothetical protein
VKELKHGIKLMKWKRRKGNKAWILAKGWTLRGHIMLRLRGYKPHDSLFGEVLKKELS